RRAPRDLPPTLTPARALTGAAPRALLGGRPLSRGRLVGRRGRAVFPALVRLCGRARLASPASPATPAAPALARGSRVGRGPFFLLFALLGRALPRRGRTPRP